MKISILTPTYNREKLLHRLYESIIQNSKYELEIQWLIMDDGSLDNTKNIIQKYIQENKIQIQYYYQKNKGKMEAINNLLEYATGDLIIECDSDDYFKDDAFKIIENSYNEMDENTYALAFLKYDQNGKNIGKLFKQKETTMFDLYFKQGEDGEKALVFNSKIRKKYKYELENNEKFSTESRMYHKMDLEYKLKCINEPIMICEYQKDGYSKNIKEIFKKNPYGYYKYFNEMFNMNFKGIYFSKRIYIIKHYILFATLTKAKNIFKINGMTNKILLAILYVPGRIMTKIKFK